MPKWNPIVLSIICAFSIAGCAGSLQTPTDEASALQPVFAIQHGGATGEAMYRLGRFFEGQARYEQAISAYREALKRDPLSVDAYNGLGMALAAQRRYDDAIRQFQAAVVLAPQVAYLHNNLGYAYLLSGANQEAVKALEEARRLDPGHEKARENLRVAQAKLAAAPAQEPLPSSPQPAARPLAEAASGISLVEVAPQIFELRTPARQRKIEAVLLEPLPQKEARIAPARSFRLEVSNGNGVLGLAKRVAGRLVNAGVRAARLTNQQPFQQARTEVQYREGYAAEAAALAGKLPHQVQVVPSKDLAGHIDVRLVLGKDVRTDSALFVPQREGTITAKLTVKPAN